jgi:hypothetical protein
VITTHVVVTCGAFRPAAVRGGGPPTCNADPREFDHVPEGAELVEALAAGGYVTDEDGQHWCPRHAERGTEVIVGAEYQEIAPGVLVRVPFAASWAAAVIEVKRVDAAGRPCEIDLP